jgi:hypothetical protein
LGVDLSAQPAKTACCRIQWPLEGPAEIVSLDLGWTDNRLLELSPDVDAIGIDAPFGFPKLINDALPTYAKDGRFPVRPVEESVESWAQRLRFRETDRAVHRHLSAVYGLKLWPLSVSSNLIAVCAWRCAGILTQLSEADAANLDRVGDGPRGDRPLVVEVYPAAALAVWGLPFKGYKPGSAGSAKSAHARGVREAIVVAIERKLRGAITIDDSHRAGLVDNDDLLDAFVAALVTRAAGVGHTVAPRPDQRALAEQEGWIHVPSNPLDELIARPAGANRNS